MCDHIERKRNGAIGLCRKCSAQERHDRKQVEISRKEWEKSLSRKEKGVLKMWETIHPNVWRLTV